MSKKSQYLFSILTMAVFVFLAFGSEEEDENKEVVKLSAIEQIKANKSLTKLQKDSLLKIELKKEIKDRESQTFTSKELFDVYVENEVNADKELKGKWFYVRGKIDEIGKDLFDDIYVRLDTGDLLINIQCYIDDEDVVSKLKTGQRITVFGKCKGMSIDVQMIKCKLVKSIYTLKKEYKKLK